MMGGALELVFDLSLYRPVPVALGFLASAAICTAVAAVASSGRTRGEDPEARQAFATNMAVVVLVLLGVGGRHAAGSDAQAAAVLRFGYAAIAAGGVTTLEFVARLVGVRLGAARVLAWAGAVALGIVSVTTDDVVRWVRVSDGAARGGAALVVLLVVVQAEILAAFLLAWRAARRARSTLRRRQLFAVTAAYGVGGLATIDILRLLGVPLPPLSFLFLATAAGIMAHAIHRFHLLGTPDLGWRALAWLCASALAMVPVVLVLLATSDWPGWTRPAAAALSLELLYLIVRGYARRVQPAIDDLFLRRRRDVERDLDDLAETLLVVRALPALAEEVARFLGRALYARPALFAVRDDGGTWRAIYPEPDAEPLPRDDDPFVAELAARREVLLAPASAAARRFFERSGAAAVIPLGGSGPLLGLLAVAPRPDGAPFVPVEIELLGRLAPVVSASLSSARLYDRRQALRRELEDRVAARAHELARAREALERAQDDVVRREKMATLGLVVGGVAADLEQAVAGAARTIPGIEADLAACEAAATRALAARPELASAEIEHVRQDVKPLVAAIAEGTRRARAIASDLSLFARPGSPPEEPVDLAREIEAALTLIAPDLAGRIAVTKQISPDLPPVSGDARSLGQVFLNVLVNAAQAIEGTGTIVVQARALEDAARVEVVVRDSGKGIPPEHMKSLFEPFFTTKVGATRGGSGLGLFVSYGIVQRHGGALEVESEVGKGSAFRVVLPVMPRSH
jgi:signal transduction histidine kinase